MKKTDIQMIWLLSCLVAWVACIYGIITRNVVLLGTSELVLFTGAGWFVYSNRKNKVVTK